MEEFPPAQPNPNPASRFDYLKFPWWLVIIIGLLLFMSYLLVYGEEFNKAFNFVIGNFGSWEAFLAQDYDMYVLIGRGITVTIFTTLVAFVIAMVIGLVAGLGRISDNVVARTLATTYVEFIRGVPTLVLIFTLALVIVPAISEALGIENSLNDNSRAIFALAIIYGAFLAELFRAGIESIPSGQMEAARALGMTHGQAMRLIILPQAFRNILPALGNDFIAMLKDSSLVSVLGVRDITQQARLYAGSSFRFRETYLVLAFLYLMMTLTLSLLLRRLENRLKVDER